MTPSSWASARMSCVPILPRMNWRLLDYAKNGGSLVVEYQRDFAWNKLMPAPFPAKMADQGTARHRSAFTGAFSRAG